MIFSADYKSMLISKNNNARRLQGLKKNGELIILNMSNCEIRENNYYEEAMPSDTKVEQIDALYNPNRNYRQIHIQQSAIIYYYVTDEKKIKMVSQPFECNAKKLRNCIEKNKVTLYVSKVDKTDYAFEALL